MRQSLHDPLTYVMAMNNIRILFIILCCFLPLCSFSQKDSSDINVIALKVHYGSVFIHTPAVKNVTGSEPYGTALDLSKIRMDSASYQKCNCFSRYGIALSYFDFDNTILGHGEMISYFLEPSYRISNNLKFSMRAAAGITYDSNPYSKTKNPANNNYETHLNPYLQVGTGFNYNLSSHLSIAFMGNFQHFSNGGFRQPNRGLNWITGSIGFFYYTQNNKLTKYKHTRYVGWKSKKAWFETGILYVPTQGYNSKIMGQRKYLYGVFGQVTKQYGKVSGITGGAEIYYDEIQYSSVNKVKRSPAQAGIHAGHIFLFSRVSFSQQIGLQLIKENASANDIYLRFGLSYILTRHFEIGVNLKTHEDNADFADFRVMYRF